jgi:hypothetical protein
LIQTKKGAGTGPRSHLQRYKRKTAILVKQTGAQIGQSALAFIGGFALSVAPLRRDHQLKRCGEMPEWSNGAVSKTVVRFAYPGFESLSLRHFSALLFFERNA